MDADTRMGCGERTRARMTHDAATEDGAVRSRWADSLRPRTTTVRIQHRPVALAGDVMAQLLGTAFPAERTLDSRDSSRRSDVGAESLLWHSAAVAELPRVAISRREIGRPLADCWLAVRCARQSRTVWSRVDRQRNRLDHPLAARRVAGRNRRRLLGPGSCSARLSAVPLPSQTVDLDGRRARPPGRLVGWTMRRANGGAPFPRRWIATYTTRQRPVCSCWSSSVRRSSSTGGRRRRTTRCLARWHPRSPPSPAGEPGTRHRRRRPGADPAPATREAALLGPRGTRD